MCTCVFLVLKKNEQHESCKISRDRAFQMLITLRNCSKEVGGRQVYIGDFGEWVTGGFGEYYMQNQEHIFTESLIRVTASHEEQTSS